MSDKRRLSIDLDEIERQLRQGAPQGANAGQKSDPLAELARIVGQDDPFGALLDDNPPQQARTARPAPRQATRQAPPPPGDPYARDPYAADSYADDPRAAYAARGFAVDENGRAVARPDPRAAQAPEPYAADPYADEGYAEDAYDERYDEADVDDWQDAPTGAHARNDAADWTGGARRPANAVADEDDVYDEGYDDPGYDDDYEDEAPRRGLRKSIVTAVALVAVGVVGVGTALWFAGSVDQTPGEPPLIAADPGPVRVEPADPGGRVIPNQDTALLNSGSEGETTVVDREEQPIDLSGQTGPRVVLPGPNGQAQQPARPNDPIATALGDNGLAPLDSGLETPLEPSTAVAALGEPRRVRTVTVRPDGSVVGPVGAAPAPQPTTQPAAQFPATAPAPIEPIETTAATPSVDSPSPDLPIAGTADPAPAPAPLTAVPLPPQAPPRTAAPATTAAAPTPTPAPEPTPLQLSTLPQAQAPAATQEPAAPTGGYAVQLAIRGSEDRARQAFDQIRGQYSSIIGDGQPIIRQAVVNGNTIYRVRVGPYSLERANQACEQIKAAAGDCFVAPNR